MTTPLFVIYKNETTVNNITSIKEFSDKLFILEIENEAYEIIGNDLVLKEVTNDNKTIKITGNIDTISKKNKIKEKNKSFIRRLFS